VAFNIKNKFLPIFVLDIIVLGIKISDIVILNDTSRSATLNGGERQ